MAPPSDHPAATTFRTSRDGIRFLSVTTPFRQITEVPEYWMSDIRNDDHVLDIGANIGAFCIRAAKISRHVTAVEPVTADLLARNIALNGVKVRVIHGGLGDEPSSEIEWDGVRESVPTFRLRDLVRMAEGCDFLKCDCEGAEWNIHPDELKGIRRIEMELHLPPIGRLPKTKLLQSIAGEYTFKIDRNPVHGPLGLMGILHAWRNNTIDPSQG